MKHSFVAAALTLLFATIMTAPLHAQRPQVLVLGTYHMSGSSDYIQTSVDDVLSPKRQREIQALADRLATFRPTKIMVEATLSRDSALNEQYRSYLAGSYTLTRNEIDQIGFRLAKQLGHRRIYAIDFKQNEDLGSVMGWAAQHDTSFMNMVQQFGARMQAQAASAGTMTILEYLRLINSEEEDALGQNAYLRMARVGRDTVYVGADVVAGRYARNLKIFANLARLTEPGDRVLVIYGAGHGKLLRDFVGESADLELVPVAPYLSER